MTNFILDQQCYSFENSMNWGLCAAHLDEACDSEKSGFHRAYHGVICLIEASPIIGQIASLFELCVVKAIAFYQNPYSDNGFLVNSSYMSIRRLDESFRVQANLFGHFCMLNIPFHSR